MRRLLLLAALVLPLAGCYPGQVIGAVQTADNLGGARFTQSQAAQGFDTSSYTLSDRQVETFRQLLITAGIDPGDYRSPETDGCTGGITTRAQLWFHGNGDKEMIIDGCGAADGTFEQLVTDLFSAIREGHGNDAIESITLVQGDREFTQSDPAEVSRFGAALDRYAILFASAVWVTFEVDGAEDPCRGAAAYDITAQYTDGFTVGPIPVDGCDQSGTFADDASTLFTEWRVAG